MSDPERRRRVEEVCDAALDREARERTAFVAAACAGDEALRQEVEALLAHAQTAEGFLVAPVGAVAAHVLADEPQPSLAGRQIGAYTILSLLGAGGMGEVYRARDTKLGRDVAIKVVPDVFLSDYERLARFEREARVLATLNHPHIGAIYGLEETDPSACSGQAAVRALVLELVEGETLAERLAMGPLPIQEALLVARQIAEGLEAAHEKGIVHRDLKPANIKATPGGIVKILDFGVAKAATNDRDLSLSPAVAGGATQKGIILGTAAYMSPEQARGQAVDKRTDVWAFGCVLYEMLTGRQAFAGETLSDTIAAILGPGPDWQALPETAPASVRRLLQRCVEKDPRRRLHDIADARIELEDTLARGRVDAVDGEARAPLAVDRASAPGKRERVAWTMVAIAVLAVGALAVPTTMYFRRAVPEPVVTRLDVLTPPTTDGFSFALSPNGRLLVFVATGEKGPQLWLRPLEQVRAQPVAGTEGASAPFWAPDGRTVGFFADRKLKRVELAGGGLQVLADAPNPRGGTWSPEGVIVFSPGGAPGLTRIPATGGSAVRVTHPAAEEGSHRWPQFLPDGRRFLFLMAANGQLETQGIYVGSLDGGEPTRVIPTETAAAYASSGHLLLVSNGALIAYPFDVARATVAGEPVPVAQAVGVGDGFRSAFSVSAQGILAYRAGPGARRQLVWVDRSGKLQGVIGSPNENLPSAPELAPDGQRVATPLNVQGNIDVWLIEEARGVPRRFTFDVAIDNRPLWSPDGRQVVFSSSRSGRYDLFLKPASGVSDEQQLLVTPQNKAPLDWSRDGRFLLYGMQDPETASDLWVLPLVGERKPFAVLQSRSDEIGGQFSPDGRLLAYASNESGRYEIYVRTFPEAGGKWQVSAAGGAQPRWKQDGSELFYVAPDTQLMAIPILTRLDTSALEAGTPVALFPTRLAIGGNAQTTGFQARAQYAVASDGRFLMNIVADDAVTSPITIVQNWQEELKRLVPPR